MIAVLQNFVELCFWVFLALVMGGLCTLGAWVVISVIRAMRREK